MNNFCEYFSKMAFEKKLFTILFCPCVTIYYLLYNFATQTLKFFIFINTKCLWPLLDCIATYLSKFIEKICSFFDFLYESLIKILSRILQFFVNIAERFLSIFKPIFACFSRIFSCIFTAISQFFQKFLLLFEAFWKVLCITLEACLKRIYQVFCQRICLCFKDFLLQILEYSKKYLIYPMVTFMTRILSCFYDHFIGIFRTLLKPINDYLLLPLYNFLMKYCFLVFFRVFQSLFHQIRSFFSGIYAAVKDTWISIRDLFANVFFQGRKRRIIIVSPTNQSKNGKRIDKEHEDLEQETMNKQAPEQIFCLSRDDFILLN